MRFSNVIRGLREPGWRGVVGDGQWAAAELVEDVPVGEGGKAALAGAAGVGVGPVGLVVGVGQLATFVGSDGAARGALIALVTEDEPVDLPTDSEEAVAAGGREAVDGTGHTR